MRYDLLKILLVDDNHYMRILLAEILRAIGVVHIYEANDPRVARQRLRSIEEWLAAHPAALSSPP